jgi:hypothetical protein
MKTRRQFIQSAALALWAMALPASAATAKSKKKGWAGSSPEMHRKFGASWFYGWAGNGTGAPGVEFVPMINNGKAIQGDPLVSTPDPITALLGYNEPERASQGNLSVDEAIVQWPRLVELAASRNLRIGSPAPSSDKGGMEWLAAFMDKAKKAQLKIDFVALHWYRGRDAAAFASWLDEIHRKYHRPLWITEFNGWAGTPQENETFLRAALRTLERETSVERYAYFNPSAGHPCALLKPDGSLTRLGELYLAA